MVDLSKVGPVKIASLADVERAVAEINSKLERTAVGRRGGAREQSFAQTKNVVCPVGIRTEVGTVTSPRSGVVILQGSVGLMGAANADVTVTLQRKENPRVEIARVSAGGASATQLAGWTALQFGGSVGGGGLLYLIPGGTGDNAAYAASTAGITRLFLPSAVSLRSMAWDTSAGDATTAFEVRVNGAVSQTVTLTGATGVTTGLSIAVAQGAYLELKHSAGTVPGGCVFCLAAVASSTRAEAPVVIMGRDQTPTGDPYSIDVLVNSAAATVTATQAVLIARSD